MSYSELSHISNRNTLILSIWVGEWPSYFPWFLKTAGHNSEFGWLILSDQKKPLHSPENIEFKTLPIKQIEGLIAERTGLLVDLKDPRKLCDLKPAYGDIFKEELIGMAYWGFCDLDMIMGDIPGVLESQEESGYDVISFYPDFLSGPFCVFRNSGKTRELYMGIHNYKSLISDPSHFALDENHENASTNPGPLSRIMLKTAYLTGGILSGRFSGTAFREIRYGYQWYEKRKLAGRHPPHDLTEVVFRESRRGSLRTSFMDWIVSDRKLERCGKGDWSLTWSNGKLIMDEKPVPLFHFAGMKSRISADTINYKELPDTFQLRPSGIQA